MYFSMEEIKEIRLESIELERPAIYVVATPVGNLYDITLRGLQVLRQVDLIICEERKVGARLMRSYGIKQEFVELNEHNEKEVSRDLSIKIVSENLSVALISDAGTPLFADPGNNFIPQCWQNGIKIIPVPGASSIMATLMSAGISSRSFLYYGFLPANRKARQQAIRHLPSEYDLIILEAPYRLKQLTTDLLKVLGKRREAVIAYKLTYPEEQIISGDLEFLSKVAEGLPKGEFVFLLRRRGKR